MKNNFNADDLNPFEAPRVNLDIDPNSAVDAEMLFDASPLQRFIACLIDGLMWFVGAIILMIFCGIVGLFQDSPSELALQALIWASWILYYVFFEFVMNRTIGKMVAGTRVYANSGARPGFGSIVLRTLCRLVPFEAFSAFAGGRMWHDEWSKTRTVTTRRPKWAESID